MRLTVGGCRQRQARLLSRMSTAGIGAAVIGDPRHVLYFTGYQTSDFHQSAAVLRDNGSCVLVSPPCEGPLAVDEHIDYDPAPLYSLRLNQSSIVAQRVRSVLTSFHGLLGLDKDGANGFLGELAEGIVDLGPDLFDLRRAKDPDELDIIRRGVEITGSCYRRAREILSPGVSELDVYAELYCAAVGQAGEKLPAIGNDFQCGTAGGPPRARKVEAGELYILDLGVLFSGYHVDNARTFAVDGSPSELQKCAWQKLVEVFSLVEDRVKPGVSCRGLFQEVKAFLDADWPGAFFHHLGHGIGLSPHERPNLNPHWDHCFEEGDLFTVEPGLYDPQLHGGIRLEEDYLVTRSGVEKLTSFPLEL